MGEESYDWLIFELRPSLLIWSLVEGILCLLIAGRMLLLFIVGAGSLWLVAIESLLLFVFDKVLLIGVRLYLILVCRDRSPVVINSSTHLLIDGGRLFLIVAAGLLRLVSTEGLSFLVVDESFLVHVV